MIDVRRYTPADQQRWDEFVEKSKNGVFLFQRGYMEYHADRFTDHSLLFEKQGKILAVLPANEQEDRLFSHAGLTFGGLVSSMQLKTPGTLDIFTSLKAYGCRNRLHTIMYKSIPHIYHRVPAEEDRYALFRHGARLCRRDISSALSMNERPAYSKLRKSHTRRAQNSGLEVRESQDFSGFMEIVEDNLKIQHGVTPTHSAAEIAWLAGQFPDNIRLFVAHQGAAIIAGVMIYKTATVVHSQYVASTPEGRKLGGVDRIFDFLLNEVYSTVEYFDFGISTTDQGHQLNEGLIRYKESYGARAVVYDWYEWNIG